VKKFLIGFLSILLIAGICDGSAVRPKGTTRFQTLSAQKSPLPSAELDNEFNNLVTSINGLSLNQQSSQWYDASLTAAYVSSTVFTVIGNKVSSFPSTTRVKFDITGSSVYSEVVSATYSSGPNTTTVTILDPVIQNPIIKVYYAVVTPVSQGGSVSLKMLTGYASDPGTTANTIPVRNSSGVIPGNINGDAQTIQGYAPTIASNPNTIVLRNSSGQITGTISGGAANLNGYAQDTGTAPNSIPVRDSTGNLPGNCATSTNATTHAAATGAQHGATSSNSGNTIVYRDGSGNFSAGTITATLNGPASSASSVPWSGVSSKPTTPSGFGLITATRIVSGTLTVSPSQVSTITIPGSASYEWPYLVSVWGWTDHFVQSYVPVSPTTTGYFYITYGGGSNNDTLTIVNSSSGTNTYIDYNVYAWK
jgi:hypothetical protein